MKNWLKVFILFFIAGLLVYFNSLNNKFIIDDFFMLNNPVLSEKRFISSQWNPYREQALGVLDKHESLTYYRPLAHMELDFSYATFKKNYWQYHLLNIILLVFASSLVYLLIEKLTGNYTLAFLAGLFYLIHPINGIVVNYISASVFAFQVIFMLGTVILLWESLERKNNRVLYILSLLCCFSSLFWNESGIMAPFYISAAVLLFRKETLKEKVFYLLPYFIITLFYLYFRSNFLGINERILEKIAGVHHMTFGECLAGLFQVYTWYIAKLFYPHGIVMKWAAPFMPEHVMINIFGLFLLLVICLLLFVLFSKDKVCLLGLGWLSIGFAPVCLAAFIKPENGAMIEPHWFIFSSIGFFVLVSYGCLFLLDQMRKAGFLLIFILILGWGLVSHAYNQVWADQKTYAQYWSQHDPNLKSVYLFLAEAEMREGGLKDAAINCKLALSGYALDEQAYNDLGVIDKAEGNYKEAEADYTKSLKINPDSARAYNNLAYVYLAEGRMDKARANFERALMLNPLLTRSKTGLALINHQ